MIELSAPAPLPADLVSRIREAKPLLLAVLGEAAEWRARHREALDHWQTVHPEAEAAKLAWGELQNRWHRLHGERVPKWQCAGCGDPIAGRPTLDCGDGNRVHLNSLDCVIRFGACWRGAATRALTALGLRLPAGEVPQ